VKVEWSEEDRAMMRRALTAAHGVASEQVEWNANPQQLYLDAAHAADRHLPGPLGAAVAAVLVRAAEGCRAQSRTVALGETHGMLALAVAVLDSTSGGSGEASVQHGG